MMPANHRRAATAPGRFNPAPGPLPGPLGLWSLPKLAQRTLAQPVGVGVAKHRQINDFAGHELGPEIGRIGTILDPQRDTSGYEGHTSSPA